MGNKYKAVKRKNTGIQETGAKENNANIGKGKILLCLVLLTSVVGGIYIVGVKLRFQPIFHFYWIISAVLLCVTVLVQKRNEYRYTKNLANKVDEQLAKKEFEEGKRRVKYLLLVLIPFLFTVFCDGVYLIFLSDLDFFKAFENLFK